ncbi:hypothetical protein Pmani_032292 [Petrolisthes manimaculis]|uniref:Uncharacterized protein n=1 Tax=Petrolisthes manimaculis TaxID=1843537 RepID=A0AAE1NTY5_9EUCA|nr:hypothetical protein Pmani_032292 [Petrolisthes manimaculis]
MSVVSGDLSGSWSPLSVLLSTMSYLPALMSGLSVLSIDLPALSDFSILSDFSAPSGFSILSVFRLLDKVEGGAGQNIHLKDRLMRSKKVNENKRMKLEQWKVECCRPFMCFVSVDLTTPYLTTPYLTTPYLTTPYLTTPYHPM